MPSAIRIFLDNSVASDITATIQLVKSRPRKLKEVYLIADVRILLKRAGSHEFGRD
jgi:hypothetical protein